MKRERDYREKITQALHQAAYTACITAFKAVINCMDKLYWFVKHTNND